MAPSSPGRLIITVIMTRSFPLRGRVKKVDTVPELSRKREVRTHKVVHSKIHILMILVRTSLIRRRLYPWAVIVSRKLPTILEETETGAPRKPLKVNFNVFLAGKANASKAVYTVFRASCNSEGRRSPALLPRLSRVSELLLLSNGENRAIVSLRQAMVRLV